jgi:DNA-binding transcriptional LysR family regulator
MNYERLKEFILIAESGSFARTAARLQVSAAVLSARFSKFENSLGVRLLARNAHRVELTADGRCFFDECRELLEDYQRIARRGADTAFGAYRRLKLAVMGLELPPALRQFLRGFNRMYPGLHLEFTDDAAYGVMDSLEAGDVDVYFAFYVESQQTAQIRGMDVCVMNQYVFVPKDHPLAGRTEVSVKELEGEQFILYPKTREPAIRRRQEAILEESGISYSLCGDVQDKTWFKYLVSVEKGLAMYPLASLAAAPPDSVALSLCDGGEAMMRFYCQKDPANEIAALFADALKVFLAAGEGRVGG